MIAALKIFHIAVASAWFGHKLLIPRDVRDSVHAVDADRFVRRLKGAERLGIGSGLLTLLSGLALIYWGTGFADAPVLIYVGLGGALAMILVGALVARPASRRIVDGLNQGEVVAAAAAEPAFRRALLLENVLWVGVLTSMVLA